MKRILLILAAILVLIPLLKSTAFGSPLSDIGPVVSGDHGLHVDLWTDRNQDAVYETGDAVGIYFRANSDCYVTIYSIGSDGEVELLFPRYPDDGFVFGGMTYRLPEYYDDWGYRISGPDGVAYLHAVGTRTPRAFRFRPSGGRYHFGIDPVVGDPFLAINAINGRLILSTHIHATATVSFFIGRRVWYPRYACYDCHGRSPRFDPYYAECPRYVVRLTRDYDYWWAYDYHPVVAHSVFGGPFWRFELRTVPTYRHRKVRYVDYALGYRNYHPLRRISRPPQVVVYKSPVITTRRTYQKSAPRITYTETRTRDVRSDGTRVRTSGGTRSMDRDPVTRSRNEATTSTPSTRSRNEATTSTPSTRSRNEATTSTPSTRSRNEATTSTPSTRSRNEATRAVPPAPASSEPSSVPRSSTRSNSFSRPDRGSSVTPEHRENSGGGASRSSRISSGSGGNTSTSPASGRDRSSSDDTRSSNSSGSRIRAR
jgi:hypothetical protein